LARGRDDESERGEQESEIENALDERLKGRRVTYVWATASWSRTSMPRACREDDLMSVPKPMLAQSSDDLPVGGGWTYEVKWDGYRCLAVKESGRVTLWSRNQKDLTRDYPGIEAALGTLRVPSFVIDGEVVVLDATGRPSFQALQHRSTRGPGAGLRRVRRLGGQ
jgi:bifunctional non-homologous end joining protein LigD